MESKREKIRIILKKAKAFLLLFILLNVCVFSAAIIPNINKPYSKQKMMMQSAAFITVFYIIPISKVFGIRNIFTLPFYAVRDKLYYTAYNMYPKDEAEKEIQWYAVRYTEYHALYHPLLEYFTTNPKKLANNKDMWRWTDEFYNNAMLLAHETTYQPYFNKYIYRNYIGEISQYLDDRPLLFKARDNYRYKNLLSDSKEIDRFNNILTTSEKLKKDFEKNNQESLNYFLDNPNISPQEFLNKHQLYTYLLLNKGMNYKFSCNDNLLNKYFQNRKLILEYLKNPPIETIKTSNREVAYGSLYTWKVNKELENTIETQCKIRLE